MLKDHNFKVNTKFSKCQHIPIAKTFPLLEGEFNSEKTSMIKSQEGMI